MGGEELPERPEWWNWELEFTAHFEERMDMRGLAEVELRTMLEMASELRQARRPGRWLVRTRHGGSAWKVVVEPDEVTQRLLVVTAYRLGR